MRKTTRGKFSKAATSLSLLFAVLLLLSLPGEGSEGNYANVKRGETDIGVSLTAKSDGDKSAVSGFSYGQWLATGQSSGDESWTSGTFILKAASGDIYRSRLSAAWRDVGARALNIQPLLRDELLLRANNRDGNWQSAWKNHREAVLLGLVDGTSDALLGGVLEAGRTLGWVRRLDVDFRTELGERPGSFGIDAILALHERKDDASGLQLRGFFGNKLKGANAGLFYRRAIGESLLGGNIFLDYENIDNGGDFWRWSLGGEWHTPYIALSGNRYFGITEGKRQSDGTYIYTAGGTDAELALRVPYMSWLSGVLGYYEWDGEYGDKADKGFRYGIRADRRFGGLSFEVEYEDPEEGDGSWGGRITYKHDFGKGAESASSAQELTFDPRAHFFDAVRREYTQRIRKTTGGNVFTGRIRISYLDGRATIVGSDLNLQMAGSGETFTTTLALISVAVSAGVTTTITGSAITQTISPPNDFFITATGLLTAFTASPSTTLRISTNNWEIELHSELVFSFDSFTVQLLTGTLGIVYNAGGISQVSLTDGPTLHLLSAVLTVGNGAPLSTNLQLDGGLASLVLNATNTLSVQVNGGRLTVYLAVGSFITYTPGAGELILVYLGDGTTTTTRIGELRADIVARAIVLTGYTGSVGSLSVSGREGNRYSYNLVAGDNQFTVGEDGVLSLTAAQNNVESLTLIVQVGDKSEGGSLPVRVGYTLNGDTYTVFQQGGSSRVTVGYTLLVGEELRFEPDKLAATITTYDSGLVIHTVEALGGIGDITYARVSANPPALAANFNVGSDNGEIRIQQPLTTPTTLSLYIRASENIGDNRFATLLLTVAAVDPPPLAAALVNASAVFLTGETGVVASLSVSGGDGAYTYSVGGDFAVGADGLLSLASAQSNVATLTATVTIEDSHDNTAPVNAFLTLTIAEGVSFVPSAFDLRLTTYANSVPFTLHRANLLGGLGTRSYALVSTNPSNFDANITVDSGGDIIVTQTISNVGNAGIYVRGSAEYGGAATLLMLVGALDPPDLAAAFDDSRPIVLTGYSGLVATVNSSGGLGNYSYGLIDGVGDNAGFAIGETDGRLSLTDAQDTPTILTAAATVNDEHPNTPALTLILTLRVQAGLAASFTQASVTVLTRYTGVVASVLARGGDGDYRYALIRGGADFAVGADGLLSLRVSQSEATTLTAGLRVDAGGAETPAVTVNYTLTVVIPSALTATPANASVFVLTGYVGDVASLSVSGGVGAYTYAVGGDFAVSADGLLSLALAQSNVATLTATVTIDDEHADTTPITAGYTLLVVEQLRFASAPPVTITTYDRGEVFYTAEALGGIGDITYLRVSANPPALADNFDLFFADGEVFLQQALTTPTTLSLYIEALEQIDGTDRRATLLLTVAAVDPPPLAAALVNASAVLLVGETGDVASLSVSGGGGTYTYSVGGDFAVSADGLLSLASAQSNVATLTAAVTIDDSHDNTAPASAFLTLTIAEPVSFNLRSFDLTLTTYANSVPFTIYRVSLSGGAGARSYAVIQHHSRLSVELGSISINSSGDVIVTQTVRNLLNPDEPGTRYLLNIRGSAEYGGTAELPLYINVVDPPALAAAFDDSRPVVLTGQAGLVATVNSGGGRGNYRYGLIDGVGNNASFAIGATDGRLSLTDGRSAPTTLTAVATVNDAHPNTPAVTLSLTLRVVDVLVFTPNRADIRITTYQSVPYALHTATAENPSGGDVTYSLLSTFPANFTDNINFTPSDRVVSLTAELTTPVSASIYIRATTATEQATLVLQLAAVDPPPLAAAFDDSRPIVLTGYSGLVATVNSGGGRGNYRYGLIDGAGDNAGFTIGATDGRLSLTDAQDTPTILTAAATVNDEHPNTPALTLSLTLRVVDVLVFTPDRADIRITTYRSVPYALHTATVQNPSGGDVSYSLLSTFPANFTDNINFTPSDRVVSLTAELTTPVSASIYIRATTATEQATLVLQLAAVDPPPLAAALVNASVFVLTGETGVVASLSVSGGVGAYTYAVGGDFTVSADGLLSLAAGDDIATLTATVTIDDSHDNTAPITAGYTLLVVEQLRFASAPPVTITTYDRGEVFYTAEALGGIGGITYVRASVNPTALAANFDLFFADGEVLLQRSLTTATTLSLYIEAIEQLGGITRYATLLLTVAAVDPPPLAAALVNASAVLLTGETGVVASLSVSGGDGAYTYSVGGDFAVGADGLLSLASAQSNVATLTATVTIDDSHDNTTPANAFLTLTIAAPVSFVPDSVPLTLTTYANGVPFTIRRANLLGGLGTRSYALVSTNPSNFDANITVDSGGDVIVTQTISVRSIAGIYVRGSAEYGGAATLMLLIRVNDPPDLAAAFDNSRPVVLTGHVGLVATVNSGGGLGNYSYGLIDGAGDNASFAIGATDGRLSLTEAQDTPTILTAVATVNDEHPNAPTLTLSLTLRVVDVLVFTPDRADIRITTYRSVPYALHTATAANPSGGEVSYSLLSTFPANFTDNINFTPSDRIVILTADLTTPVSASIYIRATTATERATLVLQLAAVDPPPLAAALVNASAVFLIGETGVVASLSVSGGDGAYTYAIQPVGGNLTVGADGRISLLAAVATPTTLTATLTADDGHRNTPAVALSVTLAVLAGPALVNVSGAVLIGYTGPVASVTNAPSGNRALVLGDDNFTLGADGVLSLTAAIGVSSVLTAGIVVDELSRLTTLNYTLTIASCSFFSGCQPFVDYAGGVRNHFNIPAAWTWISNEALTRSLIAAGADVSERRTWTTDTGKDAISIPIHLVARQGIAAVASLLLDAGADVNITDPNILNLGVLHISSFEDNSNAALLVSLFIAHGVDVNLVREFDDRTPLDEYKFVFVVTLQPPL